MTLAGPTGDQTGPAGAGAVAASALPPVLSRLMRGTFFLALKTPIQVVLAFVSIPLVQRQIGEDLNGAYVFAWGFGFFQFLLEFGMSSSLQRQVSERWTRGDRDGVNRAIACGMNFYAAMSIVQAAALLAVAHVVLPRMGTYEGASHDLIVKLLWLQAITSPCFGLATVISSVLQAARRYDFLPRLELVVVVLRFAILYAGLRLGYDFFAVVAAQTAVQVGFLIGPGLRAMVRDLGFRPHFLGARRDDYRALFHISLYMFLIQLSVVLADKVDTTVLGLFLPTDDPFPSITVYQNVSKPFLQIRQTGWTLAYLVMPAVASLVAARDDGGLDRIKYDGPRFLIGLLLPVALLAAILAGPFLTLWVGPRFAPDAPLLRLFLVGTLPLIISVQVQMAIGVGAIRVVALAALAGSAVNLPISIVLTRSVGLSGVIWGTVLTTLVSNLIVPGLHVSRVLAIDGRTFLGRTLSAPVAGGLGLVAAASAFGIVVPAMPSPGDRGPVRYLPFLLNLAVGLAAYAAGYLATPTGRSDLALILRKLHRRA